MNIQIRKDEEETVLVLVVVGIIISIVWFVGFHGGLQRTYDNFSESLSKVTPSFAFVVDDQWTNNLGVDSNYINYKGTIWNPGLKEARNVTLIVDIMGIDSTLIERELIRIGDVGPLQSKAFDVNVYYSGEPAKVSVGTMWN